LQNSQDYFALYCKIVIQPAWQPVTLITLKPLIDKKLTGKIFKRQGRKGEDEKGSIFHNFPPALTGQQHLLFSISGIA
jgi:hypothetical protein